jgi:hypothetical protein
MLIKEIRTVTTGYRTRSEKANILVYVVVLFCCAVTNMAKHKGKLYKVLLRKESYKVVLYFEHKTASCVHNVHIWKRKTEAKRKVDPVSKQADV